MRILVTSTESIDVLVTYLRRCGCSAEIVGSNAVEASPPPRNAMNTAHLRMELDAYLRVWRAMHPDVGVELVAASAAQQDGAAGSGTR
jgi:hypothetical protein